MALYFVKTVDGEDIARDFRTNLKSKCDSICILTLDESICSQQFDDSCVVAFIVTPMMLKSLNERKDHELKAILDQTGHNLLISNGCTSAEVNQISDRFNRVSKNSLTAADHLELSDDDQYDTAELRLRNIIRKAKGETISRPSARKFIIEPNSVTEGVDNVKIILLDDDNVYRDVQVQLPGFFDDVTPQKIRNGVWMLKIHDLSPGEHELRIRGDATDLGSACLKVVTKVNTFNVMLPEVVRNSPMELLSELFQLNNDNFEDEFVDFIRDRRESNIILQCVDRILEKGCEGQTCLHFCAKYNLFTLCKHILDTQYKLEIRTSRDASGKTALDIAEEMGHRDLVRILRAGEKAFHTRRSSSGVIEGNHSPRRQPASSLSRSSSVHTTPKYQYQRKPHIYEEIVPTGNSWTKQERPYDLPWSDKDLPGMPIPGRQQRSQSTSK